MSNTYSFLDVHASITGPGGSFSLGSGSGAAEEGITVSMTDDKNAMQIGADGSGMHSLHAGKAGTITVRLLKTSPVNQKLSLLYNLQTATSILHGQNLIRVNDVARGDLVVGRDCAFAKHPDLTFAKDGNVIEWVFHCLKVDELLGSGAPSLT